MHELSDAAEFPRATPFVSPVPGLRGARALIVVACGLGVFALAALVTMLFAAPRAALTSDESLYISEGLNIARGLGPKYSTGELVQHRPFLFPAMLALPLRITGDFTSVYWVTKAIVVLNAMAVTTLASRLSGRSAAFFTAALVLPCAFLNSMGLSAYLDGTETLFMLLSLLLLWQGYQLRKTRWCAAAGASLGFAFLTKEAALLWLPLPVVFLMLSVGRAEGHWPVRAVASWAVAFTAVAGWWWPYVYAVDGRVYMWSGSIFSAGGVLVGGALGVGLAAALNRLLQRRLPAVAMAGLRACGLAIALGWIAAFVYTMETQSWPYPKDFTETVPDYLRSVVAGNVQPWPLVAGALIWILARGVRDPGARLVALGLLLWLPFASFVANRNFALRDLLPMIYLVYLAAGMLLAELLGWLRRDAGATGATIAGAVIVSALIVSGVVGERAFLQQSYAPRTSSDWGNPLVERTADWLNEHVPPGTPIMSSRLYFSHIYTLTAARYPVSQLPTVNVVPKSGRTPFLVPRTTLFRWEDHELVPQRNDEHWLTVDEYVQKRYFTALSEADLIDTIRRRGIDYVIISGEDAAFSSTRYLDYFSANPAFSLVHEDQTTATSAFVFRVDRQVLAPRSYATVVPGTVLNHLYQRFGTGVSPSEFVQAINPGGVVARPSAGLEPALAAVTTPGD